MQAIVKISVLLACLGAAAATVNTAHLARAADRTLLDFMLGSRSLQAENPQRSMACFDYYTPLLHAITSEYEAEYTACIDNAELARSEVDDTTKPARQEIEEAGKSSCGVVQACTDFVDSISYFECFANAGSGSAKVMYTISANATEELAVVRESFRLIDNEEGRCTTASERAYIENTSSAYEGLQSCLQGSSTPPTAAPTSTTVRG